MEIQWPLVFFTVLNGAGAWLIALVALNEFTGKSKNDKVRFIALIVGIVLVVVGGCASALHLSHIDRMMGALSHPTSGIFTEALLTGLITVAAIIYVVLTKREGVSKSAIKVFAVISGVLGLILPFATGISYMMAAKPAWDTILFPLACFATTAITGAACYLLIQALQNDEKEAVDFTGMITLVFGIAAAVLSAVYAVSVGEGFGSQALLLWGGVVLVGGVLPAVCGALVKKGNSVTTMAAIAVVSAFIGSFAFRCFMWLIGTGVLTLIGDGNWFGSI